MIEIEQLEVFTKMDPKARTAFIKAAYPDQRHRQPIVGIDLKFPQQNWMQFKSQQYWSFETNSVKLHTYRWKSQSSKIKALIVIVHGLNSHSNEAAYIAHRLAQAGYEIVAFDLRGFGKSEGRKGYVESIDVMVDDVVQFIRMVRKHYQNQYRMYVCGLSLGGLICLKASLKVQVDRYMFFAPSFKSHEGVLTEYFLKTTSYLFPNSQFLKSSSSGNGSKNPNVSQMRNNDPYKNKQKPYTTTLSVVVDSIKKAQQLFQQFSKPFLMIQGGTDKSVDPMGAIEFYQKSKSSVKEIHFQLNLWHYIWYEQEIVNIMDKVVKWLENE